MYYSSLKNPAVENNLHSHFNCGVFEVYIIIIISEDIVTPFAYFMHKVGIECNF